MLNIIYNGLGVAVKVLSVLLLIFFSGIIVKHASNNVVIIKVQIVFESIFFALFTFRMILAVMLSKSISDEILCAIIWIINIVQNILNLKKKKTDSLNVETDTFTDSEITYNKDVIDIDCTEVQDIDN